MSLKFPWVLQTPKFMTKIPWYFYKCFQTLFLGPNNDGTIYIHSSFEKKNLLFLIPLFQTANCKNKFKPF